MAELKNLIVEGDTRLIGDTTVGKLTATSIKTSGGTSSQFVKGDGTLDSTSYLPTSGGTISGSGKPILTVNSSAATETWVKISRNNTEKGGFGYHDTYGTYMYNKARSKYLNYKDDGTLQFEGNTVYHAGNFTPSNYAPLASPALTGTPTAPTATAGTNTTQIATTAFVKTAIDNLPEPMIFKGSVGTDGTVTWANLASAAAANEGWTYKVITAHTADTKCPACKVGDTIISNGSSWVVIPSGDEPSGTVTSVTIKATSPIAIDSSSAITSSGTRTLSHANSGVTAGTYKSVTVNATGHVTAGSNPSTLAGYGITDAKIASGIITLGSNSIAPVTIAEGGDTSLNHVAVFNDDGSTEIKDSGFTIGKSVPSNADFTNTWRPLGTGATDACAGNDSRLHSPSSLTAQTTQAVYPIKIGANGHITAYGSAVTIPTVPTFSSLTLSTTAQKYDGTHTLALPSSDPYSSARTPSSHTHGNIQNGGTLQTNDITIANGDKLVVTDSSDSSKVARTSIAFDASTATKCLTQKGTWESFTNNAGTVTSVKVGTTSYSPESGVVSLPAYPTVPTFSTLTLSKTAQAYDGTHTLALPSSDPYTSARTPSSHTHGNIQNGGTLQTTDVAIANGDKLVVTDSSDSSKVARTSLSFDGSTATKCLTQKGTWESFTNNSGTITKVGNTSSGAVTVSSNNSTASFGSAVTVGTVGGVDLKFTMPANPDTNTHRPIKVNGTQILGNNTTAVNFVGQGDINIQGNSSNGNITVSHSDSYHRLYGDWDTSAIPSLEDSVDDTIYEIWLLDGSNYRVLRRSYVMGEDQEIGLSFDCMDLDGSNRFCYYRLDFDDGGSPIRWRCRREGVTVFDYQDGGD